MGVARLLAKGWIVFCLFAGAHALGFALRDGGTSIQAAAAIVTCALLFAAMGLLFIAGFGMSSGIDPALRSRLAWRRLLPSFDGTVFLAFVALNFAVQTYLIVAIGSSGAAHALKEAMSFATPGLSVIESRLAGCGVRPPYVYSLTLASGIAWLMAMIFLGSAMSRIRLTAGLLRLEHAARSGSFSPTVLAAIYGAVAIVVFQLIYVGSAYRLIPCSAFFGITGAVLFGLAPLLLAYLIFAALAMLRASGPEHHPQSD